MGGASSKNRHVTEKGIANHEQEKEFSLSPSKQARKGNKRKKRYLKQVKRDKKSQRVTKDQLYRLSFDLKRTAWYLGRRLNFNEKSVQKILTRCQTSQEMKMQILYAWRAKNGWKATVQNLVIFLELAGYDYDEYKSLVTSQENGEGQIYDKAPEIAPIKSKWPKGHYRYDDYDVTNGHVKKRGKSANHSKIKSSRIKERSPMEASREDIIAFTRKSWKKPSRQAPKAHYHEFKSPLDRTEDSGIVTSLELSGSVTFSDIDSKVIECETERNCSTKSPSSLYIRRYSDSTLNYAARSPPDGSESELLHIFQQGPDCDVTVRQGAAVVPTSDVTTFRSADDDVTSTSSSQRHLLLHKHEKSTDSQLESYKNQIVRMSQRHYDVINKESARIPELPQDAEKETHPSCYNFFKFGGRGRFPSRFKGQISGLDLTRNDDVVLSDSDNKRIQIFDKLGNFRTSFDTNSELNPKGIFVTQQSDIVVCCGNEVRIFTINGSCKMTFGQGTFRNNCYSILCDNIGNYYVTDIVGHTVSVYDTKGNIRKRFGHKGDKLMNLNQPVALAISTRDELLISDSQNHSIKVYSMAGRPLYAIGGKGTEDGKLWNPFGLCFDRSGFLYVADCGNNRISIFDKKYKFLRHVLTEADGLRMPSFIKINSTGQLVVSEWNRQEVKVFSLETAV